MSTKSEKENVMFSYNSIGYTGPDDDDDQDNGDDKVTSKVA
ncbi:MAG TPA: hypothetical protein VJL30_03720 [Patescibacteria group bacterium]|nr:hypothetical protein [Patescibacteria group bacterium]